jgi:dipeptidyl aminopeptidase/acylaminoacyl peptidase
MRLSLPCRRAAVGALCAVGVPAALAAQAAPAAARRAFTPTDWYRVSVLSAPAVSPDGRRVAFTVQTMVERDNRYHREIWVAPTAGGPAVRFTSPGTESSNPYFSPDGKYLFFTSSRPGGQGSTWALRMDEPGGEATQLAWAPPRAASWSRDGRLAVWADADSAAGPRGARTDSTAADPFARTPMARPPFGAITRPLDPRRFDGRHVVDFPYKSNDRGYVPNRREVRRWTPSQLWTLAGGDTVKKRLTSTAYSHQGAALSPDGRWIAFVADSALRPDSVVEAERDSLARLPYDAKRDEAERNASDIYVIPAAGGAPRKVATIAGTEANLSWSADGKQLGFVWRPARTKSSRLTAVDVATGRMKNLLGDWKYEPGDYEWLPNGDVMMSANVGGRGALFRVSAATGAITEVLGGRRRANGFAYDGAHRTVAYVASSVTQPTELYVAGVDGKGERKLTAFNEKLTNEVAFSDAERLTYPSVGGLEIEGWLMKPYGYEPGKKYPLVLYIHGGPHSAYDEGWFDEFQNLAATGMWVLYTNPRGSSNYGADFTYSTRGRWGAEDYEDLMKAVDLATRRPDVDSTKLGVTGGSYGGFMTAWITTRTNRFKAAQTDRMISDWTYWYGASDAQGLTEFEFFGKPWDNFALYDTLSPIRHVTKVRTPTLLVQSEEDFRTPMGNAELWFIALRKQGVPAELVRYPRSTHELSRSGEPWLLVDRLGRLRQWFGYWLQGTSATTAAAR